MKKEIQKNGTNSGYDEEEKYPITKALGLMFINFGMMVVVYHLVEWLVKNFG